MKLKLLIILGLILTGCTSANYVIIKDKDVEVEIVKTEEDIRQGLMFRENLEGGMLFLFEEESKKSFWMKNTLIPLDIRFINSEKEIVDTTTMQPCKADPCETYTSKGDAMYV